MTNEEHILELESDIDTAMGLYNSVNNRFR